MPQTSAGSKNNAWIAYMRECAKAFHAEQAARQAAKPTKTPRRPKAVAANDDQAKAAAQLKEWKSRQESRQRALSHAHMQRALEHSAKAEAGPKQKRARQSASR